MGQPPSQALAVMAPGIVQLTAHLHSPRGSAHSAALFRSGPWPHPPQPQDIPGALLTPS